MWIIGTEDLKIFLPENGRKGGKTAVDVSSTGTPRLFDNENSARIALGLWLAGPFVGHCDWDGAGGWYSTQETDPSRKPAWEGKLAPRQIRIVSV